MPLLIGWFYFWKDDGYIGRRMLSMEMPWKRKRGRPIRSFMDAGREDMAGAEVTEEDAEDRTKWRWKICYWRPWRERSKEEEEEEFTEIICNRFVSESYICYFFEDPYCFYMKPCNRCFFLFFFFELFNIWHQFISLQVLCLVLLPSVLLSPFLCDISVSESSYDLSVFLLCY